MPQVELRASPIAGRGPFALGPIASGSVVLEQDGIGQLNHSCEPNLGWAGSTTLVAVRDIADGEELTIDYATAVSDPDFVMVCHCGTYRCRQIIEGSDWQIPQLRKRYAGIFTTAVQKLIDAAS